MQVFYSWTAKNTQQFLDCLLKKYFYITDYTLLCSDLGKKYIQLPDGSIPLHFSITHSKNLLAIAFFEEAIGVDAECIQKTIPKTVYKNLTLAEQEKCMIAENFYKNWTAKESFVKLQGKSILAELKKLVFVEEKLYFMQHKVDCFFQFKKIYNAEEAYIITTCTHKQVDAIVYTKEED